MTPELAQLQQRVTQLEGLLYQIIYSDRYVFQRKLQIMDGRNIQLGTTTGTKIGTATTQKLGFFNASPVAQQAAISAPSGGVTQDSQARSAISSIITEIKNLGLTG